jgi:hypothetical protein
MVFNPSPKVAAARDIANRFNKRMVIVLMLDEETMEFASYGATPTLCTRAKRLADKAYDAVYDALEDGE